jgi:hypothetical protein
MPALRAGRSTIVHSSVQPTSNPSEPAAISGDLTQRNEMLTDPVPVLVADDHLPTRQRLWRKKVEVGLHRGFRVDGAVNTADFDLPGLVPGAHGLRRGINHLGVSQATSSGYVNGVSTRKFLHSLQMEKNLFPGLFPYGASRARTGDLLGAISSGTVATGRHGSPCVTTARDRRISFRHWFPPFVTAT